MSAAGAHHPVAARRVALHAGEPGLPTLVFVHGVFHGSWAFGAFSEAFRAAGYPVALVDLRGRSGPGCMTARSDVGFAGSLENVRSALDEITGEKVIVGHSLGGLLAMALPERDDVTGRVLIATPPPGALRSTLVRLLVEFPRPSLRAVLTRDPAALYHHPRFIDRYLLSARTEPAQREAAHRAIARQREPFRVFRELVSLRLPVRTPAPTLVLVGALDPTVTVRVGRRLGRTLGAAVVVIGDAGHDIMLDPGAVTASRAILQWLRERRAGATAG